MTNNSVLLSTAIYEQLSGNVRFDFSSEILNESIVALTAEATVSNSSNDVIMMQWVLKAGSLWSNPCGWNGAQVYQSDAVGKDAQLPSKEKVVLVLPTGWQPWRE